MKTLYLRYYPLFGWYLSSADTLFDVKTRYFRKGEKRLFESTPTWFGTKEEAREAAEEMGFKVVEIEMVERKVE